jgi:hypothetical protein
MEYVCTQGRENQKEEVCVRVSEYERDRSRERKRDWVRKGRESTRDDARIRVSRG